MNKPRIIAVHLLNDFSGSPLVFREALQVLQQHGYAIDLITATPSGKGFLSDIPGVSYHPLSYRWSPNRWLTLLFFFCSQASLFFRVLWEAGRKDIVYINSMLPFGAALAGSLRGCVVIYHIHEVSIRPALLKNWLVWVINRTAQYCIYVSNYVREHTDIRLDGSVIHNALPAAFVERCPKGGSDAGGIGNSRRDGGNVFTVLMLCSLKTYKGINEFVQCARELPEVRFDLVLNASGQGIRQFFSGRSLPSNLFLYDAQSDTHPFYAQASIVLNLSLPDQWIETFGMTILEAMYYRRPVIVPPVGGVSELVENGMDGFCIDSRDVQAVIEKIHLLSTDAALYERMSHKAYQKAFCFGRENFGHSIVRVISKDYSKKNSIYEKEKGCDHRYSGDTR
jgi:L-malate glycosyltransferase